MDIVSFVCISVAALVRDNYRAVIRHVGCHVTNDDLPVARRLIHLSLSTAHERQKGVFNGKEPCLIRLIHQGFFNRSVGERWIEFGFRKL